VGEGELAALARQDALAEEITDLQWRAQRKWLLVGAGVAAAGLGVVVGATQIKDSVLPAAPSCYGTPCAVVWDHDIQQARYREVVEQRDEEERQRAVLAVSGAALMVGGAAIIAVATQASGGPHLSEDRTRELIEQHNLELARRLGLAAPPAEQPSPDPTSEGGAQPGAPPAAPTAPPATRPAPSAPPNPEWMFLPAVGPGPGLALQVSF